MTMLSVSSCPISVDRLAPMAARIAISRARTVARAINKFATLATTISSTQPTAPRSTSSGVRADPTRRSCSGVARPMKFDESSGYCFAS